MNTGFMNEILTALNKKQDAITKLYQKISFAEQWLKEKNACTRGVDWFCSQEETDAIKIVKKLMTNNNFNWANWLIVRCMNYKMYVSYAVFAAESVLSIFEKQHPNDKRPRQAIEAAKKCIDNPSEENKKAAAAYAAVSAAAELKSKIIAYGLKLLEEREA